MRLSEWAAEHFYLSAESSYVEQKWTAFPYQTAVMDCISNDDIREIWWRKSARVGYTKIILAAMGYFAHHKHRNQCIWQPTDQDAEDFVKTELDTMLRDVSAMDEVFPAFLAKNRHNTMQQKLMLGSTTYIRGGKAAKNYRRLTIDVAYLDELDGFDTDIEKEGSPVTLAGKRIEGATFPKLVGGSTPKSRGFSLIEARENAAERKFRYVVPCPHCSAEHPLTWGGKDKNHGMKWRDGDPESVAHLCRSCGSLFNQAEYLSVWALGRWVDDTNIWIDPKGKFRTPMGAEIATPLSVAFHIWTAYSPMTSWSQIVREFLAAQAKAKTGDKSELKSFVNTTLGETWEEDYEQTDQAQLMHRAEDYRLRTVPMRALILSAGVDVQDNRFEIVVWGWGAGEEGYVVDYTVMEANPADERDWERLDAYLQTRFSHASGQTLGIEACAIDTGGHFTHQVYNFCRLRASRRVFAVKGDAKPGKEIKGRASAQDVNWRGKVIRRGVKLWMIGTDTAKDLLHGRLQITEPGPGRVHFSRDLPQSFYEQLTAEVRVKIKTAAGEQYRWQKRQLRNEVLDCTVYAMFAAQMLDLHRYTEKMWDRLRERVNPVQGDIFAAAPAASLKPLSDAQHATAAERSPAPPPQARTKEQSKPASRGFFSGRNPAPADTGNAWL